MDTVKLLIQAIVDKVAAHTWTQGEDILIEVYDTSGNQYRFVDTYVQDGILCLDIERQE